jgi:glycosyltransferase involved in cell wall biosynthesis
MKLKSNNRMARLVPNPRVSIIIPTYNREHTVRAAVQSALEQTYRDTEIIVVDDGSNDGTEQVLRSFGSRIRVIQQANAGASAARNRGLAEARGDMVAFLDSDDTWFPSKLGWQLSLLDRLGPGVACCLCNIAFSQPVCGRSTSFALADLRPGMDEGVWCNPLQILPTRFVLFNQALVVRRQALLQVGSFNTQLRVLEDYDLSLRLAALGPWAFVAVPQVSYGPPQSNSLSRWGDANATLVPNLMGEILTRFARGAVPAPGVQRAMRREAAWCAIAFQAARWSGRKSAVLPKAGKVLKGLVRVRNAVFRRSPWWPQMQVLSTEAYLASRQRHDATRAEVRLTTAAQLASPGVRFGSQA